MLRARPTAFFVSIVALVCAAGCKGKGNGGSSTSPSGGGGRATFTVDGGVRFSGGIRPAPVVVGGVIYVYLNTTNDGTTVQRSTDGLTFANTPAAYPAGRSRTIVTLRDGRYRMYYFPDVDSVDVRSAISSNGLNWTVESGARFTVPSGAGVSATVLPSGAFRLYVISTTGLDSAMSSDGLTFSAEGPVMLPYADSMSAWSAPTVAYLNGQFHMVVSRVPVSGDNDLWHATSSDGRNWNLDGGVLAANPGVPISQPAWGVLGGVNRIYFVASPPTGNAIGSGVVNF